MFIIRLLLIITLFQLAQCCLPSIVKALNGPINHSSYYDYPWLILISEMNRHEFGLSYGSLIHPKAVLTALNGISDFPADNLNAETNCKLNEYLQITNCMSRKVTKIIEGEIQSDNNDDETRNLYAILILEEPFDINQRIGTINLTKSIEDIDKNNCYFIRWMRVLQQIDDDNDDTGLVTTIYETPFVEGKLDIGNFNKRQLATDRDWIISYPFHKDYRQPNDKNPLNFMGSPLVCRLKEDLQKVVLAGIAVFWISVTITDVNTTDISDISYAGTTMKIVGYENIIMKQLNENV